MHEFDKRMIDVIDTLINKGVVKNRAEFCQEINMNLSTVNKILRGINHFTSLQIQTTCKRFKINANYIFGLEENIFHKKTD